MIKIMQPNMKGNYAHVIWGLITLILFLGLFSMAKANIQLHKQLEDESAQKRDNTAAISCQSRQSWTPGTTREFSIASSDELRTYRVRLPDGFKTSKTYPVVFALAGKGEMAEEFQLTRDLDDIPAIMIYPQAKIGPDGVTAWQGAPYAPAGSDVHFIRNVLDKTETEFCIQKSRVYTVGWSNGGGLAWLLSCSMSDRIAATAIIAGAFYSPETDCESNRAGAIINIHGDQDPLIPYLGSPTRRLPGIDSWIAKRAESNGCERKPTVIKTDTITEVTTWQKCKNNATVQNVRLLETGHLWPVTLNLKPSPAKTSDTLWRFFERHPLY